MRFTLRHILPWLLLAAACCAPVTSHREVRRFTEPPPIRVRLLFAGDVMQHLPQVLSARRDSTFDYGPVFEGVAPRFRAADVVVVNLETTLTHSRHYTGYPRFRSPLALGEALRDAGVDVAVMANNHCCDGDAEGVRTTVGELDRLGILRTGVFVDSLDYKARNPLFFTHCGVRFALVNYTYGTNGIPVPKGMVVNGIDTVQMAADVALARAARVDCIVAFMHWGEEYQRRANAEQRCLAAFLRKQGVDVVIGSHPHVVQPVYADSSQVVVYSLGNFVSNQRKQYTDGGIMAAVDAVKHPDGRMTYGLETIPVWVALPGYRILPPEVADTMALPAAYRRFRVDTEELLGLDL